MSMSTLFKWVAFAAAAVFVGLVVASFVGGHSAPAGSPSQAPSVPAALTQSPVAPSQPSPSSASPPAGANEPVVDPTAPATGPNGAVLDGQELVAQDGAYDTFEAQWKPVIDGFGAAFASTDTGWADRVLEWCAPGLQDTVMSVNPAKVTRRGYLGYELAYVGVNQVMTVAHFSSGGDLVVELSANGGSDGGWWVTNWYDAPAA